MSAVIKCSRCARRMRRDDGWNVTVKAGVVVGYLCPDCQSTEEDLEAQVNLATIDYGADGSGRLIGKPKGGAG